MYGDGNRGMCARTIFSPWWGLDPTALASILVAFASPSGSSLTLLEAVSVIPGWVDGEAESLTLSLDDTVSCILFLKIVNLNPPRRYLSTPSSKEYHWDRQSLHFPYPHCRLYSLGVKMLNENMILWYQLKISVWSNKGGVNKQLIILLLFIILVIKNNTNFQICI